VPSEARWERGNKIMQALSRLTPAAFATLSRKGEREGGET
jgi:hypothetical protein